MIYVPRAYSTCFSWTAGGAGRHNTRAVATLLNIWIKLFFVLTPFFALTMFLTFTERQDGARRRRLALTVTAAVALICLVLFVAGRQIFALFGITLDSFRVGAGILLLLSGIRLVQGRARAEESTDGDFAVVPLAIPIIVGPATTGTILVMGAELNGADRLVGLAAMFAAVASVGGVLMAGTFLERVLGLRGLTILSRLTGLILSAIAAQMIMTGARAFLAPF